MGTHAKFDSDEEKESPTETKEELNEDTKKEKTEEGEGGEGEGEKNTKRKRKRKRKKKSGGDANGSSDANSNTDLTSEDGSNKLQCLKHTVYVEGIPFEAKEDEVKNFFVENGCADVLQMRLQTWQDSGRLRGYGHVVFNTTESRDKAIKELSGKNLHKRYLTIQEPKSRDGAGSRAPRTQPEGCRTVFVKNMPYRGITEQDVEHVFRPCGKIVDGGVRLTRNYTTKELKGFGYIEFKNPEGAFSAVQRAAKGGIQLKGRSCYVDYEEGAMKGSYRNESGKLWSKEHGNANDDRKKRSKY